jgi:hypothetical protein
MMARKYLRALISIAILAQASAALSADTQPVSAIGSSL